MSVPGSAVLSSPPSEPLACTTHRILAACDPQRRGIALLHADLFDARPAVARSAIEAVGKLADPSSIPHLLRLLAAPDEDLACAAAASLGRIRHPNVATVLVGLLKTTQSDRLREACLSALADAGLATAETAELARRTARSPLVPAPSRAYAAGVLFTIAGPGCLEELVADGHGEVLELLLERTAGDGVAARRLLALLAPAWPRLSPRLRAALTSFAAALPERETAAVLRAAIADPSDEVRRAAYAAVGTHPHHAAMLNTLVDALAGAEEGSPALEDEAVQAVARLAPLAGEGRIEDEVRDKVRRLVAELFRAVSASELRVESEAHELGWIIRRSCEYLEYYGDDELKAAILRHLRGGSETGAADLARRLKATAVRVEVRHFEGYSALGELIKNPQRHGVGLIIREMTRVRTGKGRRFNRLVRALRLAALFAGPEAAGGRPRPLDIFVWARQERLFRLAEAALAVIAKASPLQAVGICRQCLTPPVASKILAIAALYQLATLDRSAFEPAVAAMLGGPEDAYLTLNAVDAIAALPPTPSGAVAAALLGVLRRTTNREILEKAAACLGEATEIDLASGLRDLYRLGGALQREAVLVALDRRAAAGRLDDRESVVEFLYGVLREGEPAERAPAAALLWNLGEEYALEVIRDLLAAGAPGERAALLEAMRGHLRPPLVPVLEGQLADESPLVQEAVRSLLGDAADPETAEAALALSLRVRGAVADEEAGEPGANPQVQLHRERDRFRFERECVAELTVLFTDIVGYSRKAEALPPMQLAALLQEYERSLVAIAGAHRGELVKRMGDGHLFVFVEPLDAVLAAIRLQKSLRRFNRYRAEAERVAIRIGVHCGKVVRKEGGDVLGNTVNIAARLEQSAQPGSILMSVDLHERVRECVLVRELGEIEVKNITRPIRVVEPYEIALDLPAEKDPLRQLRESAALAAAAAPAASTAVAPAGAASAAAAPGGPAPRTPAEPGRGPEQPAANRAALAEILRTFQQLQEISRRVEAGGAGGAELRREIAAGWRRVRPLLEPRA
jgi:class 3 adenylate cyclase/HEAT repeat protein